MRRPSWRTAFARAQGIAEGNKRTALLLARWLLDRNGIDGSVVLPPNDLTLGRLLVQAAAGADVEADLLAHVRIRLAIKSAGRLE